MKRISAAARLTRRVRRAAGACMKCRRGFAATEFALILPLLVVLFFGMLETSDIMTTNRRVAVAVNTMVDLAAQSEKLTYDDIDDLFDGVMSILEPHDVNDVHINLISIVKVGNNALVLWSRDEDGSVPYLPATPYNKLNNGSLIKSNGSLIVVEMTYSYTPQFTSHFVGSPFTFERQAVRWPRAASVVPLCNNYGLCISQL